MIPTISPQERHERTTGPIHTWFGLTYSNHQVLPRTLMQSMPVEWQTRMVACMEELRAAFEHVDQPDGYEVTPGEWTYVNECSDDQLRRAGVTLAQDFEFDDEGEVVSERQWLWRGDDLHDGDYVFVPGDDPIPHYRRGFVEPTAPELES